MYFINNSANVVITKAGKFYLGDPCYCFSHSTKTWSEFCQNWYEPGATGQGIANNLDGSVQIVGFQTAFGDGCYTGYLYIGDQKIFEFAVDSGLLGLVPNEFIQQNSTFHLTGKYGIIIDLIEGDIVSTNGGDFQIKRNNVVIVSIATQYDDDYPEDDDLVE